MPAKQRVVYRFAGFEVNPVTRTLKRNEGIIDLSRRSFDLLLYFVQNSGKIISKEELLKNIWADAFVDENSLTKNISVLRMALDEASAKRSLVLTLPGRGYQLASAVEIVVSEREPAQSLAELDDGTHPIGILHQQRTVRTSISKVERGGAQPFIHEAVNHVNEYVRGSIHTQGIENFWSLLKRGLRGTYVAVEPFHLDAYVTEQVLRYNNRATRDNPLTDSDRFALVVSQVVGKRLTYAELTGKELKKPEAF
jgi:DNA-binding winged helix-turn-helix (wHTH) protein